MGLILLFHIPFLGLEKEAGPVPLLLVIKCQTFHTASFSKKENKDVKEQHGCKNFPHKL